MKFDVVFAAVMAGLAFYTMRWSFSFGSHRIYLPKDRAKWLFFDRVNEARPNFFRLVSSALAFIGTMLFGHEVSGWQLVAGLFVVFFGVYFFTCLRSYILLKIDPVTYYED